MGVSLEYLGSGVRLAYILLLEDTYGSVRARLAVSLNIAAAGRCHMVVWYRQAFRCLSIAAF